MLCMLCCAAMLPHPLSVRMQVPDTVHQMQPRHVANLSWAFAVRKAYSPSLYDALAGRMVELIEQDRGADSCSSSSSDGDSGSGGSGSNDSLFLSPNDVVLPHHLSLVAWSFAKQVRLQHREGQQCLRFSFSL